METFIRIYAEELEKAAREYPADYPWYPATSVDTVVGKMAVAFKGGTYNKEGRAIKNTCKRLGIKHTYTVINAYLKTGQAIPS